MGFKGLRHKDCGFFVNPKDKILKANWCVEGFDHTMGYALQPSPAILRFKIMPFRPN